MRRLALSLMVLTAFLMLVLAAQTHGTGMAFADAAPSRMHVHDGAALPMAAPAQCAGHDGCTGGHLLCDVVCSGLTSFTLTGNAAIAARHFVARPAPVPVAGVPQGISPALNDRPPILPFV